MNTHISRRTLLRGMGTALALPLLEGMSTQSVFGAGPQPHGDAPTRMAFLFVPNGKHMADWTPKETGQLTKLPPTLTPLEKHKGDLTLFSGLTLDGGRSHGDGAGDHARCVASFLTGAHPRKTDGKDIQNGVSVDQAAAEKIGHQTRFASLELGCEPSAQAGRCDSGYSCIYTSNMSWRTATVPMAKEINPQAVFDRLFGSGDKKQDKQAQAKRNEYRRSILDFVAEDVRSLNRRLGKKDQQKLDEYLFAVRQIERRVQESDKLLHQEVDVPDFPRPAGVPRKFAEHVQLMMDMMVLAFATDTTRIASFMFANAGSGRSYPQVGVSEGHHGLSHHGGNAAKQAKIAKINRYHISLLAYFLERLKSFPEGDGNLLDNSLILYGSGLADGNSHDHANLPILLAGRGGGVIESGRHRQYPRETPLTNLYLRMCHTAGADVKKIADSTGPLEI